MSKGNRKLKSAVVYLTGDINEEKKEEFLGVLDELLSSGNPPDLVRVIIDSGGGNVRVGLVLYDRLMRLQKSGIRVETMVEGTVFSAATIVYLAGEKRLATPHSNFGVHGIALDIQATYNLDELIKLVERMEKLTRAVINVTSERTGRTPKEILKDMKNERSFTAEEALEYGFVHEIV